MIESLVVLAICATMMVVRELQHSREVKALSKAHDARHQASESHAVWLGRQAEMAWARVDMLQAAIAAKEVGDRAADEPALAPLSAALASQVARLKSEWATAMVKPPPLVPEKAPVPAAEAWSDGNDTDIFG